MAVNATRCNYEEAAAGFRRTLEIDPDWAWGYIKLARTLALQKKCAEAFAQAEIGENRIKGGAAPPSPGPGSASPTRPAAMSLGARARNSTNCMPWRRPNTWIR